MTEPSTEPMPPDSIVKPACIGTDGREAERYPEPFPAEEPPSAFGKTDESYKTNKTK